jgi:hypothetical protein
MRTKIIQTDLVSLYGLKPGCFQHLEPAPRNPVEVDPRCTPSDRGISTSFRSSWCSYMARSNATASLSAWWNTLLPQGCIGEVGDAASVAVPASPNPFRSRRPAGASR